MALFARTRTLIVLLTATVWACGAMAQSFPVRDIRVEGLQRIEPGTVFGSLPFRIGEDYNDERGAAALRALFATGLFSDVRIEVQGNVVIVFVQERPVIADVDFVGVREFEQAALVQALRDIGLAGGRPFDRSLADRAEQELKRQYLTRSLYGAEVVTTVTPIDRNRVNLTFSVTEGQAARIREIRITGAEAFRESQLLGEMALDTGTWLSWYTKSNQYSRPKLNADLEALRSYYLNRGYLEFDIASTQVAISPDRTAISITINVVEGRRYVVTGVELQGEYLGREEEFQSLVQVRPGQAYRATDVEGTAQAFRERFGGFGYAFARVDARPEIDRDNGHVKLVFLADPARRVYVRRINVAGNARTRDEVIRREFRQFESAWYDAERIRLSRDRVDRLGFFREVSVQTTEVPGTFDQVDLTIVLDEKPTGNLLLGAGFSSSEKLSLTASVRQENVFGTGNYLGIEFNTSRFNRSFVVSSINPYFTRDGVSRSLDVFYRTTRPFSSLDGDYRLITPGASIRFGVPFSELDTVFFGVGVERTEIRAGTSLPASYAAYIDEFGEKSNSVPLTLGWQRDGRDSALVPTRGRYQRVNAEWSIAGDARYVRGSYQYQQYVPLSRQYTLAFNGEIAAGRGLNDKPFPIFKNYYAGGLGSVRGFQQGALGPLDPLGAYIGGAKKLNANVELLMPFPGSGFDRTLRWFFFADAGNVFTEDQRFEVGDLRASVGVGLSWISPVGPLKFSYGAPLRKEPGDRIERIQFQIGTAF